MKRNPAYGCWSEEETNWSDKDDAFVNAIRAENNKAIPTTFEELKRIHESLPY